MPRRGIVRAVALSCKALALVLMTTAISPAQEASAPESPVLVIDPERLFEETDFGKRVIAEREALAAELQTENRRIEAELIAEELDLTERRANMSVDEFRQLADAFDEKVSRIRTEQDGKARELQRSLESGQQQFFRLIGPVLLEIVKQRNASVLLDSRNVFLSAESVDITGAAIALTNSRLQSGPALDEVLDAIEDDAEEGTGNGPVIDGTTRMADPPEPGSDN